ncbi:MAG: hypothetical protein AAGA21_05585 [Pseudomonadota bacterium]
MADPEDQVSVAQYVAACGGDLGDLKFCKIGEDYYSAGELEEFLKELEEVWIVHDAAISLASRSIGQPKQSTSIISVSMGIPAIVRHSGWSGWAYNPRGYMLDKIVEGTIQHGFDIAPEVMEESIRIEDGYHVYQDRAPAIIGDNGHVHYVNGSYYCRGMNKTKLSEFFVKPEDRPLKDQY